MTVPHEWTPDRVAELTRLWETGLSASEIGRKLGITKNSVVGKARRMDLAMRRAPAAPKLPPPNVVTLERLGASMCSWPEGEPGTPSFRFCGDPAIMGKPYCDKHCSIAYVSSSKSKKSQTRAA